MATVTKIYRSEEGATYQIYPPNNTIYGATWTGSSATTWTRTDGAALLSSSPNPAVGTGDGSSPFDTIMPWAGMVRSTDPNAGEVVAIPKFYYKWTRSGTAMMLQISMREFDGSHVSPAHADRGDGSGERNIVYVGRYHCSTNDYKSLSGYMPRISTTRSTFRSGIHNLGSTIWQWDYAMVWTIRMLYLVEFANWNSQAVIGYGCNTESGVLRVNGDTDSMNYHTGTNQSSRTTYGGVQYRNIEGLWDNCWDMVDGVYYVSPNYFCIKNPANFGDSGGTGITSITRSSGGFISSYSSSNVTGFEYAIFPDTNTGSDTTYICDFCYTTPTTSNAYVMFVGAACQQLAYWGLFCENILNTDANSSFSDAGSRLMILP